MVQLSQTPGLGPEGQGEELRRLVMLGWTFAGSALMITRGEEKMRFWEALEEVVRGVPSSEKIVVAGDFNGHIGALPGGFGDVHGGFGFGERNEEGLPYWSLQGPLGWWW